MSKGRYVDGFVIVIPKANLSLYKRIATKASKVWLEHGALEYKESVADDINVNFGLPFAKLTKAKPAETVVFSWIVYESKAHRNKVNKAVMKDPRLDNMMDPKNPPFNMKRMSYGGFKIFV